MRLAGVRSLLILVATLAIGCGQSGPSAGTPSVPSTEPSIRSPAPSTSATAGTSPSETAVPSPSTVVPTPTATPELSAAEADLLEELRADSRIGCSPRRSDLPRGADVGVECRIDSDLVDRVGVYGFPGYDGLGTAAIGAYMDRLDERGIELGSGDCAAGKPGDAHWPAYLPEEGPDGAGPSETRIGCFLDGDGTANIRLTCYGEVYIGILGKDREIGPLYAWAMRVSPGESTHRDPPGICARPD